MSQGNKNFYGLKNPPKLNYSDKELIEVKKPSEMSICISEYYKEEPEQRNNKKINPEINEIDYLKIKKELEERNQKPKEEFCNLFKTFEKER